MDFSTLGDDFILRGGKLLLSDGLIAADLWVHRGSIRAISAPRQLSTSRVSVDVDDLIILPGVIDVHVHPYTDGWIGTLEGCAKGGVTTAFFMLKYPPSQGFNEAFSEATTALHERAMVDYGFHLALREPLELSIIQQAQRRGISTIKLFMSHMDAWQRLRDGSLFRSLRAIGAADGLALIHAESGELVELLEAEAIARADVTPSAYLQAHAPLIEVEAVSRALDYARLAQCALYFVHITTGEALDRILRARAHGQRVYAESCLPFLLLPASELTRQGAKAKVAPSLRREEDIEALWCALAEGHLQVVSSDHAAQRKSLATDTNANIFRMPSGLPGTEHLLSLFYDEAVNRRGLPISLVGRVLAEMPARIFGLYPNKGTIQPGAQADLVIFDPDQEWEVRANEQRSQAGFTPYEGRRVRGRVLATFVRGKQVWGSANGARSRSGVFIHTKVDYGQHVN